MVREPSAFQELLFWEVPVYAHTSHKESLFASSSQLHLMFSVQRLNGLSTRWIGRLCVFAKCRVVRTFWNLPWYWRVGFLCDCGGKLCFSNFFMFWAVVLRRPVSLHALDPSMLHTMAHRLGNYLLNTLFCFLNFLSGNSFIKCTLNFCSIQVALLFQDWRFNLCLSSVWFWAGGHLRHP